MNRLLKVARLKSTKQVPLATCYGVLVEVIKEGWPLQDLQKQWPLGILKQIKPEGNSAISPFVCPVYCAIFWKTGRFAGRFGFEMPRC